MIADDFSEYLIGLVSLLQTRPGYQLYTRAFNRLTWNLTIAALLNYAAEEALLEVLENSISESVLTAMKSTTKQPYDPNTSMFDASSQPADIVDEREEILDALERALKREAKNGGYAFAEDQQERLKDEKVLASYGRGTAYARSEAFQLSFDKWEEGRSR